MCKILKAKFISSTVVDPSPIRAKLGQGPYNKGAFISSGIDIYQVGLDVDV